MTALLAYALSTLGAAGCFLTLATVALLVVRLIVGLVDPWK